MKKSKLIAILVAASMMVAGLVVSCAALAAMDWDFTRLNSMEFVTNAYQVEEPFTAIQIDETAADVRLAVSGDGTCRVVCKETDSMYHTVEVKDGTLTLRFHDDREPLEYIGIFWGEISVTVYLPQSQYDSLQVKTISGSIRVSDDLFFGAVQLQSTSGEIELAASVAGELWVKTTSGSVELYGVEAGKIRVECISGDVELERCDAMSIDIKTTSGEVEGTLLSGKNFVTETVSGEVEVPRSSYGGDCYIHTTSGDIEIEVLR